MKEIMRLGIFLMVVSTIAAAALTGTYLYTAPRIEAQKIAERQSSLKEVMTGAVIFKEVKTEQENYYIGLDKNKNKIGFVFAVAPKGYGGKIEMLVGINPEGKILGVKIERHNETPGLGSQATAPGFLKQFKGKSAKDSLQAKKDIQAITGATITTKAVCEGVREALKKSKIKDIY